MHMSKKIIAVVVLVLILFGILFVLLQLKNPNKTPRSSSTNGTYDVLMQSNAAFASGRQLVAMGQFDQAVPDFQAALASATDPVQQARIKLAIAGATERGTSHGGYLAAIPLLKQIAANTTYPNISRAYALQEMGQIFYTYNNPQITKAIFSDPPYSTMFVTGHPPLSYRHLFEYAASFYPLAIPELRVADWYAKQIYKSTEASSTTQTLDPQTVLSYKQIIRQDISAATSDLDRIKKSSTESGYVPTALQIEANVFLDLQLSGDSSFGDAIATMQSVLNIYSSANQPEVDGFARYRYALYLAELKGVSAKAEVQTALSPLYTDPVYAASTSSLVRFLSDARTATNGIKGNLILLASFDPKLKTYLISLGWVAQDFTQQ